jgi:hypothetical protein
MNRNPSSTLILILTVALTALATAAPAGATVKTEKPPRIEVCFVLDTTGSMSGLIEGAKAKIWSIANQMVSAKPTPELKIALIGYRDRGDDYVTRVHDLSADIDQVYADLQKFQAAGGGDTPESVNQALYEAVHKISWTPDRDVLKLIFLVGDCPPHMDYRDDVKYQDTCQAAVRKDLIINTVQCGNYAETTPIWQEIARRAEGRYVAIGQTGDMQVITTPMDDELARLNVELGRTLVPYGSSTKRSEVRRKQVAAEMAPAPAAADRLAYSMKVGKAAPGGGDLIDDISSGAVDLKELEAQQLPKEMQTMSPEKREKYIAEQKARRAELQARIDELVRKRDEYIREKMRELAAEGKGSAFDTEIYRMIKEQAARKGLRYE